MKMKKSYAALLLSTLFIAACSSQPKNQPELPLDMKTVAEYNSKVSSGNTVPAAQRNKQHKEVDYPLNASDSRNSRPLTGRTARPSIAVVPSFGYYHGYRHWHHW